jgi:DNA-nicking Smr family endonuclease
MPRRSGAAGRRANSEPDLPLLPDIVASDEAVGATDALSFRRPGVRDQEMRKLRRGLYAIDDELDLHGLNQAAARDSLREFLEFSRDAGHRCVRIVHGKGYRSGARGPILKIAVNAWLRRHPQVVAFTSARNIDGGTGAVYALLRA